MVWNIYQLINPRHRLATSDIEEEELDESLVSEKIGGAGITKYLYEKYESEDPVVIGTGLLSGTTYPASALGSSPPKARLPGNSATVLLRIR